MDRSNPLIRVEIADPPFSPGKLEEAVGGELEARGVELVVVDPGRMRVLNRSWRHQDRTTDVLTFDLSEDPCPQGPSGLIYVNGRLAPPLKELVERVCHGMLHLQGMSHHTPQGLEEMRRRTAEMVESAMERLRR